MNRARIRISAWPGPFAMHVLQLGDEGQLRFLKSAKVPFEGRGGEFTHVDGFLVVLLVKGHQTSV